MNAINQALWNALTGGTLGTAVTALAGSQIYLINAPSGATPPYVIFAFQGGGEVHPSDLDEVNVVYRVEGIGMTNAQAAALDDAIRATLHKQTLSVTGWNSTDVTRREGFWQLLQQVAGQQVYRAGALYRIRLDKP